MAIKLAYYLLTKEAAVSPQPPAPSKNNFPITEDESHLMIIGGRHTRASELCCCVGEEETKLNDPSRNRAGRYVVSLIITSEERNESSLSFCHPARQDVFSTSLLHR